MDYPQFLLSEHLFDPSRDDLLPDIDISAIETFPKQPCIRDRISRSRLIISRSVEMDRSNQGIQKLTLRRVTRSSQVEAATLPCANARSWS